MSSSHRFGAVLQRAPVGAVGCRRAQKCGQPPFSRVDAVHRFLSLPSPHVRAASACFPFLTSCPVASVRCPSCLRLVFSVLPHARPLFLRGPSLESQPPLLSLPVLFPVSAAPPKRRLPRQPCAERARLPSTACALTRWATRLSWLGSALHVPFGSLLEVCSWNRALLRSLVFSVYCAVCLAPCTEPQ